MPKTRVQKQTELAELTRSLTAAKSVVFSGFSGLTVKETTELRRRLRAEGISVTVAKRTLVRRALQGLGYPELPDETFAGGVQIAYGAADEVAPARVLHAFSKTHDKLVLRAGLLGKQLLDRRQLLTLAQLPSRDALRGQFVNILAAPLKGLVTVLAGPIRGLVTLLSKKAEQPSL